MLTSSNFYKWKKSGDVRKTLLRKKMVRWLYLYIDKSGNASAVNWKGRDKKSTEQSRHLLILSLLKLSITVIRTTNSFTTADTTRLGFWSTIPNEVGAAQPDTRLEIVS
jgi:hypothetical protein